MPTHCQVENPLNPSRFIAMPATRTKPPVVKATNTSGKSAAAPANNNTKNAGSATKTRGSAAKGKPSIQDAELDLANDIGVLVWRQRANSVRFMKLTKMISVKKFPGQNNPGKALPSVPEEDSLGTF